MWGSRTDRTWHLGTIGAWQDDAQEQGWIGSPGQGGISKFKVPEVREFWALTRPCNRIGEMDSK